MSQRSSFILSSLLALLCTVTPALARAEENGLKIGDGRLHPYFDLETRYDTAAQINVDDKTQASSGVPDLVFHFRPGIKLDVPSPTLAVNLGAAVEYLVYAGIKSKETSKLNRFQAEANLDLGILRGSVVSFDLGDHFTRSNQTTDIGFVVGTLSLFNDVHGAMTVAPGGGSLTISPGYHLQLEAFSPLATVTGNGTPSIDYGARNYLQHKITLENRWRFLPKTAFLLDGEYDIRKYASPSGGTDISFFRAQTGISGLLTPHVAVVARVGYARDMTLNSFGPLAIIGQLEGSYLPSETSLIRLGILRTFEPVALPYVSYEDDRAYLEARLLAISRLTLHAFTAADLLGFNKQNPQPNERARGDNQLQVGVGADLEVTRWFNIGVGDALSVRTSNRKLPTVDEPTVAGLNLTSDQVYLRLTVIY
jgi:hypothetical protein